MDTRTVCYSCALKHIADAKGIFEELMNGYADDNIHLAKFSMNMSQAASHVGSHTVLADEIRSLRVHVVGMGISGELLNIVDQDEIVLPIYARLDNYTDTIVNKLKSEARELADLGEVPAPESAEANPASTIYGINWAPPVVAVEQGVDLAKKAKDEAARIKKLPIPRRGPALKKMKQESPEFWGMVREAMKSTNKKA